MTNMRNPEVDGAKRLVPRSTEKKSQTTSHERGSRPETYAIIDPRRLERECFVRSIESLHSRLVLLSYSSAEECISAVKNNAAGNLRLSAVLLNTGRSDINEESCRKAIQKLIGELEGTPIVALCGREDLGLLIAAMDLGIAGYVPASIGIEGIIEATRLAASGGVVLTHQALERIRSSIMASSPSTSNPIDLTSRQLAVADALRKGKANKIIAYELQMCESTVKVHIRNIMRKLKASNRTEAAYQLNAMLPNILTEQHNDGDGASVR